MSGRRRLAWWLLVCVLLASSAHAGRGERLAEAWSDREADRSVFFVEGMSCRACTMILDRHLNRAEGVYWARFNYPLRFLTVYHRPAQASQRAIIALFDRSGELRAVPLDSRPAGQFRLEPGASLATWLDGNLWVSGAHAGLEPFLPVLEREFGEEEREERQQVIYEILGEIVRNQILTVKALAADYAVVEKEVELPAVIAKDFYWPEELRPASREEAAVSRFLREAVMRGQEGEEGRELFDAWLLGVWRSAELNLRRELLETDG